MIRVTKDKRAYEDNCTAYKNHIADLTLHLEHTEHQLNAAQAEYRSLVQDLPKQQTVHDAEVSAAKTASSEEAKIHADQCAHYEAVVAGLQEQLDATRRELSTSQREYQSLVDDLPRYLAEHESEICSIREEYEATISSYRKDYRAAIASLIEESESKASALRAQHKSEVARITARLHSALESLDRAKNDFNFFAGDASSQRARNGPVIADLRDELSLVTSRRDTLSERCKKATEDLEELSETLEMDAGRYQLLRGTFNYQSERYLKNKAALAAYDAGRKVDTHYSEMLETKVGGQQCRIAAFEASEVALEEKHAQMEGKIQEMKHSLEEQRGEIEQLHELLEEAGEEAMEASREAQEAREATADEFELEKRYFRIDRDSLVEKLNACAESDPSGSNSPRQTEPPSRFNAVLDRNLIARYDQAMERLAASRAVKRDADKAANDSDEVALILDGTANHSLFPESPSPAQGTFGRVLS